MKLNNQCCLDTGRFCKFVGFEFFSKMHEIPIARFSLADKVLHLGQISENRRCTWIRIRFERKGSEPQVFEFASALKRQRKSFVPPQVPILVGEKKKQSETYPGKQTFPSHFSESVFFAEKKGTVVEITKPLVANE